MMSREEYKALANEIDLLKDSGHEFDGLVRVNAKVAKNPRSILTFEMSMKEHVEIERAATAIGMRVDEFIREAALNRARGEDTKRRPAKRSVSAPRRTTAAKKASA